MVLKSIFTNKPIYSRYETEFNGKKVIMFHGDEFDFKITKRITLSKLLFPIQWVFERLGINLNKFLRNLYHSIAQKIGHKKYNTLVMDVERAAVVKYRDYDVFIMGHTHTEKLVRLNDNKFYVNTGSLINNPVYVEFDESEGMFQIKQF
jgi:UDP-2,3-diacylglucosamine pyrophosphatase LpxH